MSQVGVDDRALAWVPEVMRFAGAAPVEAEQDEPPLAEPVESTADAEGANDDDQTPRELAA
jgi:ParB family chromosome partitioning protein